MSIQWRDKKQIERDLAHTRRLHDLAPTPMTVSELEAFELGRMSLRDPLCPYSRQCDERLHQLLGRPLPPHPEKDGGDE